VLQQHACPGGARGWPAILAGSEGTLGVITRLRLRVRPIAPSRAVAVVAMPDLARRWRSPSGCATGCRG
jgi:FAD/FMN-containing dehydrogenase